MINYVCGIYDIASEAVLTAPEDRSDFVNIGSKSDVMRR